MFKGQKVTYIEKHEFSNKSKRKETKHKASKRGYKHQHNLSKGQLKHLAFLAGK